MLVPIGCLHTEFRSLIMSSDVGVGIDFHHVIDGHWKTIIRERDREPAP